MPLSSIRLIKTAVSFVQEDLGRRSTNTRYCPRHPRLPPLHRCALSRCGCLNQSFRKWLAGTKDQYSYEMECKTGSITLAGDEEERYTGLWQKKHITNKTANKVDLECAAGEITVHYPDSV